MPLLIGSIESSSMPGEQLAESTWIVEAPYLATITTAGDWPMLRTERKPTVHAANGPNDSLALRHELRESASPQWKRSRWKV